MAKNKKHVKKKCKQLKNLGSTMEELFHAIYSPDNSDLAAFEWDGDNGVESISYGEMKKHIYDIASSIQAIIGVETKDTFIALNMPNSRGWVACFWAILLTGNKPYLVNLQQTLKMRQELVKQLNITYSLDLKPNELGLKSILYSLLDKECNDVSTFDFADEFAISTSGTSMQLKICVYTGKEMSEQVKMSADIISTNETIMIDPNKGPLKLLSFLPFYHIFGLVVNYLWFAYFGSTIVLLKDYGGETLIKTIRDHHCTHVFAVPMFWHTIENRIRKIVKSKGPETEQAFNEGIEKLNNIGGYKAHNKIAKKKLSDIRSKVFGDSFVFGISGGSYLRKSALELFNGLGYPLYNGYGATEIGITSVELSFNSKDRNLNGAGKPFKPIEYKIEDDVLFVKTPVQCQKIFVEGQLQPVDEWFNTHDMAHEEKGRYFIDGRKSDLILSDSGENINPDLIEQEFNINSAICKGFSVLGLDNKVIMVISVKDNAISEEISHIKKYVSATNAQLPLSFQVSNFYLTHDDIKGANDLKASRSALGNAIQNKTIQITPIDEFIEVNMKAANNTLVNEIIEVFADVLSIDKSTIQPDSHFIFDLNGDSLDYFTVINALEQRFDFKANLSADETPCYTPNELALKIEQVL